MEKNKQGKVIEGPRLQVGGFLSRISLDVFEISMDNLPVYAC